MVYPEAIAKMPVAPLWSILFFAMILTLGIGTQIAIVTTVVSAIVDSSPKLVARRLIVTGVFCVAGFLLGPLRFMILCPCLFLFDFHPSINTNPNTHDLRDGSKTLWLAPRPSGWPTDPHWATLTPSWPLDPPIYLSDPITALSDLLAGLLASDSDCLCGTIGH